MLMYESILYSIKVGILVVCLIILAWLIIDTIINRPIKLWNNNKERDEFISAIREHNLYLAHELDRRVDELERKEREKKELEAKLAREQENKDD